MPTRQQGSSLLEVLVAMLILAVGLLGIAGMQASSMRNVHSGYLRSQATLLSYDVFERMRANRANLAAYAVAMGTGTGDGLGNTCGTETDPTNDIAEWKDCLAYLLPNGDGAVTVSGNVVTVRIIWTERQANEAGSATEGNYKMEILDKFETQSVL